MTPLTPIEGSGPFAQAMETAASGMRAQAMRMRLVAENLANVSSTADSPGGDPYRRRVVSFEQTVDRATGANVVRLGAISEDPEPFRMQYDPYHPAADATGYYKLPNVSDVVEAADMREAQRTYEANLAALTETRSMVTKTLDILKA